MLMAPERFRYVSGTPRTFTRSDLESPGDAGILRKPRHASRHPAAGLGLS